MKQYSVKDVADALNTNQETVRRWIRSGKLIAEQDSRKIGNIITDDALRDFIKVVPKYAPLVAALTGSLPFAVGSLVGNVIATMYMSPERMTSPEKIQRHYQKELEKYKEAAQKKKLAILHLQKELAEDQKHIEEYQQILKSVDFEEVSRHLQSKLQKEG